MSETLNGTNMEGQADVEGNVINEMKDRNAYAHDEGLHDTEPNAFEETYQVIMHKVPSYLSDQALYSMCSKMIGVPPLLCFKHQPGGYYHDVDVPAMAFLEYRSFSHAEELVVKLKNHPMLNLEATLGRRRPKVVGVKGSRRLKDGQPSVASFSDAKSMKDQQQHLTEDSEIEVERTDGQSFKLAPCGIMTASDDFKFISGPILNIRNGVVSDKDSCLDEFGDYSGGLFDAANCVTMQLMSKEGDNAEDEHDQLSHRTRNTIYSGQKLSRMPTIPEVPSKEGVEQEGQFGYCEICIRLTASLCSTCGKYYCSRTCIGLSKQHIEGQCKGQFHVPTIWQNKLINLNYAPKPSGSGETSDLSKATTDAGGRSDAQSQLTMNEQITSWLCDLKETSFLVEKIVMEFGEAVAFVCSLKNKSHLLESVPDFSTEINKVDLVGTIFTTQEPELEIWLDQIVVGQEIIVNSLVSDGVKVIGHLLSPSGAVNKVQLQLLQPRSVPILKLPSEPIQDQQLVTISNFCASNMCYVCPVRNEHDSLKLALDVEFFASNTAPLQTLPFVGQLVLAFSTVEHKSYRARVKVIIAADLILVHFVDNGKKEVLPLGCIHPINDALLKVPAETFLVELNGVPDCPLTKKALKYTNELMLKNTKLNLNVNFENVVTLIESGTGARVNEKLAEAVKFSWDLISEEKNLECSADGNYMSPPDAEELPEGKPLRLTILNELAAGYFITCKTDGPLYNTIMSTYTELAEDYLENCTQLVKYFPKERLVSSLVQHGDGMWYRALVEARGKSTISGTFLDFGEIIDDVPVTKVRAIAPEFFCAPALGVITALVGLTEEDLKGDEKLVRRMKELLRPGTIIEGTVLEQTPDLASVFIPDILSTLCQEGLLPALKLMSIRDGLQSVQSKACVEAVKIVNTLIQAVPISSGLQSKNLHNPKNMKLALQMAVVFCLDEMVQDIAREELQSAREEQKLARMASLKLNYFSSLTEWVEENEKKLMLNFKTVAAKKPSPQKGAALVNLKTNQDTRQGSMLSQLLFGKN